MSTLSSAPPRIFYGSSFRAVDPRQVGSLLRVIAVCLLVASLFAQDPIAYLVVTVSVLTPSVLWINSGAYGIPVLPVVSTLFYLYYAVPLLTNEAFAAYKQNELLGAAFSVALFVLAASLAAWLFLGPVRGVPRPGTIARVADYTASLRAKSFANLAANEQLFRLISIGLLGGILYYSLLLSGWGSVLGTYLGLVRAAILPLSSVACYLTGFARGARALNGQRWLVALAGFIVLTLLSMGGLFLVNGLINIAAVLLGYLLAARRIPWVLLAVLLALTAVLNAGKYSMRAAYWAPESQSVQNGGLLTLPGMMTGWFAAGIGALASGETTDGPVRRDIPTLLQRSSLLHMVLTVQQATPHAIPYLEGETYAMLPAMLVPRFWQPDKIESQAVLNLLSVRYGLEAVESTANTTIAWGMVAEAYANFGNFGVLAAGSVFGLLCGLLMRLSARASPLSLSMLVAIAATLTLCDIEVDFSYLLVMLFQNMAGIFIFAALPRLVSGRRPTTRYVQKG